MKKKILMSLLVSGLIVGLATPSIMKANELEERKEDEVIETEEKEQLNTEVKESKTITTYALTDAAFPASSKELNDALVTKYDGTNGTVKIDTNDDGIISQGEASLWTGRIVDLSGLGISSTLDGIEHFTGVMYLSLGNNQFYGSIPSGIGNMSSLAELTLNNNELSGSIPESIGSLGSLRVLYLGFNNLSGEIPSSMGNLNNMIRLYMQENNLEGQIPNSLSNLNKLENLQLYNNNFTGSLPSFTNATSLKRISVNGNDLSGDIPNEIYSLPNLEQLVLHDNPKLTGDITSGFASNSKMVFLTVFHTSTTQEKPVVTNLSFIFLFDPLNSNQSDLDTGIDQESIDLLKEEIEKFVALHNPQPGSVYGDLLEQIEIDVDLAEKLIVLNPKVEALFDENGVINEGVTQEDITNVQDLIDELTEGAAKDRLQEQLNEAQKQFDEREAEKAVDNLFDENEKIKDEVTQEDINNAQDLVNKVKDVNKKKELQDKIDEAQKQLEERDFVVLEEFKTFTGTGTVSTKIDAPVEKFSKVYVDGKELDVSNYEVTSGSIVITLNESYLKTLANKTYNVEVEFVSGAKVSVPLTIDVKTITDPIDPVDPVDPTDPTKPVEPTDPTTPTKPTNPSVDVPTVSKPSVDPSISSSTNGSNVNTGDTTDMMMLYGMLAVSILGIAVISKRRKAEK